ncbi:MAG: hypothetical protein IJ343_02510 [Clostridia bacterium]|nr:hypothetical protein [Clostridia bacterium]
MSTTPVWNHSFPDTLTCRNLTCAYHSELLAQQRYRLAAQRLEQAGLHVAAHAFRFTAAQESEHAAILRGLLRVSGGCPGEAACEPPALPEEPAALLKAAAREEESEALERFPAFARDARNEGFPRIAAALLRIADVEGLHARRFSQYHDALEDGSLFRSPTPTAWLCLPCGHLHFSTDAPERCDACTRSRGHFIRSDFHPFTVSP